jgi:hypothetical protein
MAEENKQVVDEEPPLIVVEGSEAEAKAAAAKELADDRDDADDGDGDERLGQGRDVTEDDVAARGNETDEQRRERNRLNKRAKKLRQQQARERDQRERTYLEQRNDTLERRLIALEKGNATTQVMAVDNRITQVQEQIRQANDLMAQAIDANAGADVAKISDIKDQLNEQLRVLQGHKQKLSQGGEAGGGGTDEPARRQQQAPPPKDARIAQHSRQFQDNLVWFDPRAQDTDSAAVYALDVALSKDGRFDPRTPKYWKELERRVRAALPHKFEELDDDADEVDDDPPPAKRNSNGGPRMPSGGDRGVKNGGSNTFYLSPERKQALVDAGVYNDPKLKAKYIKKFREWDEQNTARSK